MMIEGNTEWVKWGKNKIIGGQELGVTGLVGLSTHILKPSRIVMTREDLESKEWSLEIIEWLKQWGVVDNI